jgi:hypothetical protein
MMDRSSGYVQGQEPTKPGPWTHPHALGLQGKAAADVVRSSHSATGHFLFTARGRRFGATRLRSGYWRPPKSLPLPTRQCLANAGSAHQPGRQRKLVLPLYQVAGRRYLLPSQNAQAATNAASTTAPTIRGTDSPAPVGDGETARDRHDCGRRLATGRGRSPGPSRPGSRPALILPPRAITGPPRWPGRGGHGRPILVGNRHTWCPRGGLGTIPAGAYEGGYVVAERSRSKGYGMHGDPPIWAACLVAGRVNCAAPERGF